MKWRRSHASNITRPSRRWIALGVLLFVAVGCDAEDQNAEVTTTADDTLMQQPRTDTAMGAAAGVQPGARVINANLVEWDVELSQSSVPAGEVSFQTVNSGTVEHALEVEGQGIEEETEHLQPGATESLTVNLEPGTYEVYCPVVTDGVSHREQGMTTTLVVQ